MTRLTFSCTLLTDVVLNQRAATSGNQQTLDFIPGNNFLGIVAGRLYAHLQPEQQLALFHTGAVRFGDAHPASGGRRSLRVPASLFYPKGQSVADACFVHHGYDRDCDPDKLQLKQCRSGFYLMDGMQAVETPVDSSFAIKAAYDTAMRRSEDQKMYGYQSINKGQTFVFEVELDDETLADDVIKALVGQRRIGRSRTAQYGLVDIRQVDGQCYPEPARSAGQVCTVYADARLIFIDIDTGLPKFRPTAQDLGLADGEIDWAKSQVRTFQYAPWNFKRQARDTDRCGIEKGSVFVINGAQGIPLHSQYVGNYRAEGFGKVVYCPAFLDCVDGTNGRSVLRFVAPDATPAPQSAETTADTPLLRYVARQRQEADNRQTIYQLVNNFVDNNGDLFTGERFASQWGHIRSLAMQATDAQQLVDSLFTLPDGYLVHGTACEKWEERGRLHTFKLFVEHDVPAHLLRPTIINLAAEMAKKCKQ